MENTPNLLVVSNEALLDAMIVLTHRIHAADAENDKVEAEVIRQQRHQIKAEVLSRMEEGLA